MVEKKEEEREVNFQAKVKSKDNEEVAAVSEEKQVQKKAGKRRKHRAKKVSPYPTKIAPSPFLI